MAITTIIVMALLITSAVSAPQTTANLEDNTLESNMTQEEFEYILRAKRGEFMIKPKPLSPCARAILGCCKGNVMNEHCSESLKCGAFFFDANPCEEQFIISALQAAKVFYKQTNEYGTVEREA